MVLLSIPKLIRQILQGELIKNRVVILLIFIVCILRALITEALLALLIVSLVPHLLADVVLEEVAAYMEQLDGLFVISLESTPREKHVSNFAEGQSRMRLDEIYISRSNIDIPLSKVSVHQDEQINNVGKTERNARKQDGEEAHTFFDVEVHVDIVRQHILFVIGHIKELLSARQIDCEEAEEQIDNRQNHQEGPHTLLVGLIEGSLGFYKAFESLVRRAIHGSLGIFVDAAHALVTDVQYQACNLGRVSKKGTPLNHIVVVKVDSCWILIQLEGTIDIAVVIILKLQDARDHIRHMLFILFGPGLVRGGSIALLLNDAC